MAYTDEQKQLALTTYAACRNNATHAAKFCKDHYGLAISQEQILRWVKGQFVAPVVVKNAEEKKAQLAEIFEDEIRKAFGEAGDKREEASYKDLMTGIGILTDKMLLMRGEATQITQTNVSREDAALRVMEIIAQAQARRDNEGNG